MWGVLEGSQWGEGFVVVVVVLVPGASGSSGSCYCPPPLASLFPTLQGDRLGSKNESSPDQNFFSEVLTDSWLLALSSPVGLVPWLCLVFSSCGRGALRYWTYADPPQGSCLWCAEGVACGVAFGH